MESAQVATTAEITVENQQKTKAEWLTKTQLKTLWDILLQEKEKQLGILEEGIACIQAQRLAFGTHSEGGSDCSAQEQRTREINIAQKMLKRINTALKHIRSGIYDGLCIKCNKPILFKRLKIVPATRKCCACKNGEY